MKKNSMLKNSRNNKNKILLIKKDKHLLKKCKELSKDIV